MSGRVVTEQADGSLWVRMPGADATRPLPRIYVWVNGAFGDDDITGAAIAEDGTWLAGHVSGNRSFFRKDMGLTSERKHDAYRAHFPDGYELVEVPEGQEKEHPGLSQAVERNAAHGRPVDGGGR